MNNKDIDYYIPKVRNNISNIYNAFYLWRSLQKSEYNNVYNRNKYFWGIIMSSLQDAWLLGIAKLFEENKKEEVISIPFLLRFIPKGKEKEEIKEKIDSQKTIVDNLWKWRCKILAHQDKIVANNLPDFYKQYPIKGIDIENLLVAVKEILGMIKSSVVDHAESYDFRVFIEESKRDLDDIISKLRENL